MNSGPAALLLAAFSVIALLVLIAALRRASARTVNWDPAAYFLVTLGWIGSFGYALGAFTGQRRTVDYVFGFNTRYFGIAQVVIWATGVATVAFCVLALRLWVRSQNRLAASGILAVLIFALGVYINALNNIETNVRQNVDLLATLAVLIVAMLLRPGKSAVLGPAVYGVTLGIVSGLVPLVNQGTGFASCRPDKCGPLGVLFLGVLGNENAVGLALALSLPFVLLAFRGYSKWLLCAYIATMVYLTGSRVALFAVAVTLILAIVCNPHIDGKTVRGRFAPLAFVVGLGLAAVGWIIPFVTTDLGAYSGRGRIWAVAKSAIAESPLFGSGAEAWRSLARAGEVSAAGTYSTHNMWLHVFFTTGVAGLIMLGILIVIVLRSSPFWLIALPLITALTVGILEVPWTFALSNWLLWVLPALLLLRRDSAARSTHPGPTDLDFLDTAKSPSRGLLSTTTARTGRFSLDNQAAYVDRRPRF